MTQKEIRNHVLKAIYLDDDLSELMVLKGGSAISLHELTMRESFDLDFSLFELSTEDKEQLEEIFKEAIESYFAEEGFTVFSFKFKEKPKVADPTKPDWGGFHISFKFLPEDIYDEVVSAHKESVQLQALSTAFEKMVGTKEAVKIELSKREYVDRFVEKDLDDIEIKIYSPEMIIFEKLRALCQQMVEYTQRNKKATRARDFFDIYTVNKVHLLERSTPEKKKELKELLANIFDIKEVPLELLSKLEAYREFHRDSFQAVVDVVYEDERKALEEYDFYVDETIKLANWILKELV